MATDASNSTAQNKKNAKKERKKEREREREGGGGGWEIIYLIIWLPFNSSKTSGPSMTYLLSGKTYRVSYGPDKRF